VRDRFAAYDGSRGPNPIRLRLGNPTTELRSRTSNQLERRISLAGLQVLVDGEEAQANLAFAEADLIRGGSS